MLLSSELRLKAGQTVEELIDGMGDALQRRELLPEHVIEVLDLWHVMDRLWDVATALHPDDKAASREFVSARLRQLLEGNTGTDRVIGGLRQTLTKRKLSKAARDTIAATTTSSASHENRSDSTPPQKPDRGERVTPLRTDT